MNFREEFKLALVAAVDAVVEIAEVERSHLAAIILISINRRVVVCLLEAAIPFEVANLYVSLFLKRSFED